MILQLNLIFLLLATPISSPPVPIAGCVEWCGNILIPFPFGVGSDCSLSQSYNIICDNSTHPPKPYLSFDDGVFEVVEIVNISSQIRIYHPRVLSFACYNDSGDIVKVWNASTVVLGPYAFSDENWVTAIGCDDVVQGIGAGSIRLGEGCVSYCENESDSRGNGFCPENDIGYLPGNGCCRTTLPVKGIKTVGARLSNLGTEWRQRKLFSCSYAFLQEKSESNFSYPLSYLINPNEFLDDEWRWKIRATTPVVRLDWWINGADNCVQAQRDENSSATAYACRDNNSICVDSNAGVGGYVCRCKEGYQGNPYVSGGCRDLNECAHDASNPCVLNSDCKNINGSVKCLCPKGYNGDGLTSGRGCIHVRPINVFIGVGSGLGFLLLVSICVCLHKTLQNRRKKMRKEKFFKQNGGLLLQQQTNQGTIRKTQLFSAQELEKATDNFNKSRVLGQGGQGIVFKGMLSDGQIVAIKKSKCVDKDRLNQFINEVVIMSHINHRNVLRLFGCCLETEVPLLVYEYLPNGTLYDLIHYPKAEFPISWTMRLKMAADIAGALAYMHSASSTPIYHRDIKSSNILLDEKYVVKVSDFGISRTIAVDQTHLTTGVRGTFGYFDPEYFRSHQYTEKSDVYSLGVLLVELLTGQKPISSERDDEDEKSLVTRFLISIEHNNVDEILDPQVSEHSGKEEVNAVVLIAHRCLNLQGILRPTMKEVATELESLRLPQVPTDIN